MLFKVDLVSFRVEFVKDPDREPGMRNNTQHLQLEGCALIKLRVGPGWIDGRLNELSKVSSDVQAARAACMTKLVQEMSRSGSAQITPEILLLHPETDPGTGHYDLRAVLENGEWTFNVYSHGRALELADVDWHWPGGLRSLFQVLGVLEDHLVGVEGWKGTGLEGATERTLRDQMFPAQRRRERRVA